MPKKRSLSSIYLFIYNASSFCGWLAILGKIIQTTIVTGGSLKLVLTNTITPLTALQTIAALAEIGHSLTGLVPSALIPTILQLVTRCTAVHLVRIAFKAGFSSNPIAYTAMAVAWAIADLSRYLYYLLRDGRVGWFRYTQFLLLYPIGAVSEMVLVWACSGWSVFHPYRLILRLLVWIYPFGLVFMYRHMLRQRRRHARITK